MRERPEPRWNFFRFTANERTAALTLVLVGIIGACSPYWLPLLWSEPDFDTAISPELQAEMDDWIARSEAKADSIEQARQQRFASFRQNKYPRKEGRSSRPDWAAERASRQQAALAVDVDASIPLPAEQSLNPNTVDSFTLKRLAVPVRIVRRWYKFRAAGATFVRRTDISKLYGLPDTTYSRIAPYFLDDDQLAAELPGNAPAVVQTSSDNPAAQASEPLEVNRASEEELLAIRGIGPYYATRILEEREALGGFLSLDQLASTRGFREGAFDGLRDKLAVDPSAVTLLLINSADAPRLAKHPYIDWDDAKVLVAYRDNHGPYRRIDDLYETIAVDSATVRRIAPYLSFE